MMWLPVPAIAGSNVPAFASVIPVPLQVPPGVAAVRVTAVSVSQNGPAGVMVASGEGSTTISSESTDVHPFTVTV